MNTKQIQERIVALLPSQTLKRAIAAQNYTFREIDLVRMAWEYVPLLEDKLEILNELSFAKGKRAAELARNVRAYLLAMRDAYLKNDPEAVYELRIRSAPDSYEEKYICRNYEAALRMIEGFWQEYGDLSGDEEREQAIYSIVKRKILDAVFQEDELGDCMLNGNLQVLCMDDYSVEKEDHGIHYSSMSDVLFPCCIPDLSPVRYTISGRFPEYGVAVHLEKEAAQIYEYYILRLIDDAYFEWNADNTFCAHEHIEPPYVELITADDLPEKKKINYQKFIEAHQNNQLPWQK